MLQNGLVRVSTLPGGGFVGEIRFLSSDPRKSVNPMRVPHYQTIDPHTYDVAKHGALYGTDVQRRLMSGYMGEFLCFPYFGPSSKAEFALDLGQHGEALAVEWKRERVTIQDGAVTLVYSADLPKTQYRVLRSITLPAGETVAYVEESVENQAQFDRPFQWVRHVTFGPPFLELNKTFADAPVAVTAVREGSSFREESWPLLKTPGGQTLDQRVFSGQTGTWLLDTTGPKVWFTIYHTEYPVLLGYVYESQSNPWVLDWQENMRAKQIPWEGKVVARAICIGDSPFASGLQDAIRRGSLFGVPVFRWIVARQRLTQRYLFFLAEIPLGFQGVSRLRVESGRIVLSERGTGREIAVRSSRSW
ncbi:MAG: hypothetical protein ACUVXB_13400 [Bryobacteraceae bacterium]